MRDLNTNYCIDFTIRTPEHDRGIFKDKLFTYIKKRRGKINLNES